MSDPLEVFSKLEEIIRLQTEAIDGLFSLLVQHIGAEDDGLADILESMETVSDLKRKVLP